MASAAIKSRSPRRSQPEQVLVRFLVDIVEPQLAQYYGSARPEDGAEPKEENKQKHVVVSRSANVNASMSESLGWQVS